MAISVTCTCGKEFNLKDEFAGKTLGCPACGQPLTIPQPVLELVEDSPVSPKDIPYQVPGVGAFDRDRYLLKQRVMTLNEKYDVADETGNSVVFVERRTFPLMTILVAILSVAAVIVIFGGILTGTVFLCEGIQNKDTKAAVIITGLVIGMLGSLAAIMGIYAAIYPKRHTKFFGASKDNLLMEVKQDKKIMLLISAYTLMDETGAELARFRRNNFQALFRKYWCVDHPDGRPMLVAKEDSIILSILRRLLGPMLGLLRTNYILCHGDGSNEQVFGEFNRKLTLLDRYTLDLSGDPQRAYDRRVCVALGVMLDTGDSR